LLEALKNDKQVKINGLGTFRVQAVAPRKSVHVGTGEDIIIEGYNKLTFAPEAGVRELIESSQPSAVSSQPEEGRDETPVLDPLKKLGAQAEEIVDLLGDLGQSPKVEEPVVEEPEPEPAVEPEPEPIVEPEPELVVESKPEPAPEQEPEPEPEPVVAPKKPKKESHFMRDTLICVVILLLLLLLGYFFLRQQLSSIIDSFVQPAEPAQTEVVVAAVDTVQEEPVVVEESVAPRQMERQQYTDLITTEPMHEASRLAWMAKRYYGAKIYWPYLFDANRDVITNPCMIQVGTPIRVPKLTKLQLDTTNTETAAYLEQIRLEAEEICGK